MTEPHTILEKLGEPFPRNAIKSREGAGRKRFDYVEAHTVIHRLNTVAVAWDFRIVNVEWRSDLLIVQGELTIPGLGTRTGFGVQKVAPNAGEDLVKGASSDALKKAATLFGVALELYGPDYEAGEAPVRPQSRDVAPQRDDYSNAPQRAYAPVERGPQGIGGDLLATDRQRSLIQALARDLKFTGKSLDDLSIEKTGQSLQNITRKGASTVIEYLKERKDARDRSPA